MTDGQSEAQKNNVVPLTNPRVLVVLEPSGLEGGHGYTVFGVYNDPRTFYKTLLRAYDEREVGNVVGSQIQLGKTYVFSDGWKVVCQRCKVLDEPHNT